jgi:hypothetical protein
VYVRLLLLLYMCAPGTGEWLIRFLTSFEAHRQMPSVGDGLFHLAPVASGTSGET